MHNIYVMMFTLMISDIEESLEDKCNTFCEYLVLMSTSLNKILFKLNATSITSYVTESSGDIRTLLIVLIAGRF